MNYVRGFRRDEKTMSTIYIEEDTLLFKGLDCCFKKRQDDVVIISHGRSSERSTGVERRFSTSHLSGPAYADAYPNSCIYEYVSFCMSPWCK